MLGAAVAGLAARSACSHGDGVTSAAHANKSACAGSRGQARERDGTLMDSETKSQTLLISIAILAFVLGSFTVTLLLMPGTATDVNGRTALQAPPPPEPTATTGTVQDAARMTHGGREPVAAVTATLLATPEPRASPGPGMLQTAEPTTPSLAVVASLHWPERLPDGMAFAAEDSWPFRVVAPDRENEPFVIFRDGPRWLLIRNQTGASQPIPRSATTQRVQIGGLPATLVTYLDGGFKLVLQRDGRAIQISGQDLSDTEIRQVARSLRPLSAEALRVRLRQEVAQLPFQVTLLWPTYVPDGIKLAPAETIARIAQSAGRTQADGYRVSFKGSDALIQVGGGTVDPPRLAGTEEQITVGSLTGRLTVGQRRYLLVVDAGAASDHALPRFPETAGGAPKRLPLVQQGRVFVAAENIDRAHFERVVANLIPVRLQEFVARTRGQNTSRLSYLWPSTLPDGYAIDLNSVRIAWDDFLLQGGLPFFQLIASGPGNGVVTIKGGREPSGDPFVVPEGGAVERSTASIRGYAASTARTPDESVLFWAENDSLYAITSRSLTLEQLIAIGEALRPVDADDFLHRIR